MKMNSKVVGSSFRGELPWDQVEDGDELRLVHEPENKFDANAMGVWHVKTNTQFGYLPRETSDLLLNEIKATLFRCEVAEVTGGYGYKTAKGINIKINYDFEE